MKRVILLLVCIVLVAWQPTCVCAKQTSKATANTASKAQKTTKMKIDKADYWMGAYYGSTKLGYSHITIKPDKLNGKDVFRRDEVMYLNMCASGETINLSYRCTQYANINLYPISEMADFKSKKYKTATHDKPSIDTAKIKIVYGQNMAYAKVAFGENKSHMTTPIDSEERKKLIAGSMYIFDAMKPVVGKETGISLMYYVIDCVGEHAFNYNSHDSVLNVLGHEKLELDGVSHNTIITSVESGNDNEMVVWLEDGRVIKKEFTKTGVILVRQPKEQATAKDDGKSPSMAAENNAVSAELDRSPVNLDYWMGVYAGSAKLGYSHVTTKPDKLDGKDVYRRDEFLRLKVESMGQKCFFDSNYTQYMDKDMLPLIEILSMSDTNPVGPGLKHYMRNTYSDNSFDQILIQGDDYSSKNGPLDPEYKKRLMAQQAYAFGITKLAKGDNASIVQLEYGICPDGLNKQTFEVQPAEMNVIGNEAVSLDGVSYDTTLLSITDKEGKTFVWRLENGVIVKMQTPMGVTWVLENAEEAIKL